MPQLITLFVLSIIVLLVACSTTTEPTPDISALVEATLTANAQEMERIAVALGTPDNGATFDNVAEVTLEWNWQRPLAEDEVYDVRVWREGEPAYGITWTQDNHMRLEQWLLYQKPGKFFWTIAVLKKGAEGEQAQEIANLAPERTFSMNQINLDIMELPPGFSAALYARLPITQPTVATFDAEGVLYVLALDGRIVRLTDKDHDSQAETVEVVFDDPGDRVNYAVGLAFHDGKTYLSDAGRISILGDSDGDGKLDHIQPIVEGLPTWKVTFHSNNGIAFGLDGKLYVGVGSTTDHGPLQEQYEASILRMNPDGSDLEVFATGFRNPYDVTFSPGGDLFTADNSPDELNDILTYLPPEELNFVQQGKNYGFPYVYGFAGSGDVYAAPVTELFTSSASSGLTYYDATGFPPAYHGVYIAEFGTGAAAPKSYGLTNGQTIVFVPVESDGKGGYTGHQQTFARFRTEIGIYSPIDVTVGPDGALYVLEWITATVHRVVYSGEVDAADATQEATDESINDSAAAGAIIFREGANGAPACITCHTLDGKAGVGPSLLNIGSVAGTRVAGLSAEEYVRQSILKPNAHMVDSYLPGVMYQNYAGLLTSEQVDELVAYIQSLGSE